MIAIAVLMVMGVVACVQPAIGLLFFALLASYSDGRAFFEILSADFSYFNIVSRVIFFSMLILCFIKCVQSWRKFIPLERMAVGSAWAIIFLMFITGMFKGLDPLRALLVTIFSPLPAFVIWLTYGRQPIFRKLLIGYVCVQILLACLVIQFPTFDFLNAANYVALSDSDGATPLNSQAIDFANLDKLALGKYAQFHNPNALGFYAAIALAFGIGGLLATRTTGGFVLSLSLSVAGVFCWFHSYTRGPLIGIAVGVLLFIIYTLFRKKAKISSYFFAISGLILGIGFGGYLGIFSYLIPDASNVSVSARVVGYLNGINIFLEHPLLGGPTGWGNNIVYPHLLPLAYAAEYGLFVGLLNFFWLFILMPYAIWVKGRGFSTPGGATRVFLYLSIAGIALTNNVAAAEIFGICLAQLLVEICQSRRAVARTQVPQLSSQTVAV